MPVLSVITVSYNARSTIEDTLRSVQSQKTEEVEYVVIDGSSTDGTREVLDSYSDTIDILVSESDSGIYDAMNKGIKASSGRYFCFLNSGDWYTDGALRKALDGLRTNMSDVLYGNLVYVDNSGTIRRLWNPGKFDPRKLRHLWVPPHEATFIKRELVSRVGLLQTRYRIAAGYNMLLQAFCNGSTFIHLDVVLVVMRSGGTATKSIGNIIRGNKEIAAAYKDVFGRYPKAIVFRKLVRQWQQRNAARKCALSSEEQFGK